MLEFFADVDVNKSDFQKKQLCFFCLANSKYLPCLGAFLVNLDMININYDAVHVLHDELSEEQIQHIHKHWPKVFFHRYSMDEFVKDFNISLSKQSNFFIQRYSFLTYLKYKSIALLSLYRKVIVCDLDAVFIKNNLKDLLTINGFAWKESYSLDYGFNNFYRDGASKQYRAIDFPEFSQCNGNEETPNGGFIYFNDTIDAVKAISLGDEFIKKFSSFFSAMIDEIVFRYISLVLKIPRTILPKNRYNSFPWEFSKDTIFLHFVGKSKPWSVDYVQRSFPLWKQCYLSYINNFSGKVLDVFVDFDPAEKSFFPNFYRGFWRNLLLNLHVPKLLSFPDNFDNFYLIFNYSSDMYFEIKCDFWNPEVLKFGFWLKNSLIANSARVKNFVNELSKDNDQMFKFTEDKKGLYIFSEKSNIANVNSSFNYFVNSILSNSSPFIN